MCQISHIISIPLVSMGIFRHYGSPIRETITHNKNVNMSLIDEYFSHWGSPKSIHFNDTQVHYHTPNPTDSVMNRDVKVCSNDTFLLMMFPIIRNAFALRQIIRRAIPQGIMIQGKRINHVFVVAVSDDEREAMKTIRREKESYGDIVISRHYDRFALVHLSIWDGYVWVREHCRSATFTGKFDSDAIHFLGNYVSLLMQYPKKRFFGGRYSGEKTMQARNRSLPVGLYSVPYDYPLIKHFHSISGAASIISVDVIDYLMIGTMYEPYFVCAEDFMTSVILDGMGIKPIYMGTELCPYMVFNNKWFCDGRFMNLSNVPNCLCCYHGIKNVTEYNKTIAFFGNRLYTSQLTDKVNLSKPLRWPCYL